MPSPREYSASPRSSVRRLLHMHSEPAWRTTHTATKQPDCVHDSWFHAHGMSMLPGLVRSGHVLMHMQHGTSCCDRCHVICPRRVPAGGAGAPRASDGHTRPGLHTGQHAVLRRCVLDAAVRSACTSRHRSASVHTFVRAAQPGI